MSELIVELFLFCKKNIAMPKRAMKLVSGDLYQIASVHLGNPDDEKIFLSPRFFESLSKLRRGVGL